MESRPKRPWSSNHPSTHPGTVMGSGPRGGILVSPACWKTSSVSDRGDRPLALSPQSFSLWASHTMANRSPPIPDPVGSMRPSVALAAIAASAALPPFLRISRATWVASGWLVAAIPCCAMTSERVANMRPVIRS
jgi:hypothetical protein